MKRYFKELLMLLIQLFMFYIFPLFVSKDDAIGMVVIILFSTLILSLVLSIFQDSKIKYIYPLVVSVLFIPSVFIYYNESALIHSIWYLVVSFVGILIGAIINKVRRMIK